MESVLFEQERADYHEVDDAGSVISSSSESSSSSEASTMEEDDSPREEVTSHSSTKDPLLQMSSLLRQLPFKRGLSKHYHGKSQSFTLLSAVLSVEDLAKPENPYSKKLKSCKSYAGGLSAAFSKSVAKKTSASRGSCSSLTAKRSAGNFLIGGRPPIPQPHRSASTVAIANQTALFA